MSEVKVDTTNKRVIITLSFAEVEKVERYEDKAGRKRGGFLKVLDAVGSRFGGEMVKLLGDGSHGLYVNAGATIRKLNGPQTAQALTLEDALGGAKADS